MQGTPLKYFIWAFQHHTRDNIQRYAEKLFGEISPRLKPYVFLLGILRENIPNRYPICIQPEECGIDVKRFNGIDNLADSILSEDPRRNILHGVAFVQQLENDKLKRSSLRRAVQQTVDENFKGQNRVSFVSQSVHLEGYEIFIVLQFDEDIYNSFYALGKAKDKIRESLLDSLIWVFLGKSLDTLYRPRAATYSQDISTDKKEILRIAASNFIGSAIFSVSGARATWEFFNTCNYISSLKYEGDDSLGQLIVCKEGHTNLDVKLKLTVPIQLGEHRKVRKLLETSSKDLFLYSNGNEILGLGKIKSTYDAKNEDMLIVNFSGSHKWELKHDTNTMVIVEYTNPRLPKVKINKEVFDDLLKRIFSKIFEEDLKKLWCIVNNATNQKHGTLLIISSEAEEEADRLKQQSMNIKPVDLDEDLTRNVTSIDGAVLLDNHGVCHSIGVILDGIIVPNKGNSVRGARYNSAVRYVENNKKKCIAIIISEDGMVDLYPNLLPRIRKSEIEKYLNDLRNVGSENVLDNDEYRITMNWLENHEFYLTQEQCDEINKIKRVCDSKEKKDPYRVFILYQDLKPNPDMDDSYLLNDEE